jgi:octaprenyl-diphosphate synthase
MGDFVYSLAVLQNLIQTSQKQGSEEVVGRLDDIYSFLEQGLKQLEEQLMAWQMPSGVCGEVLHYMLSSQGKRIRPICVLLASQLRGVDFKRVSASALALALAAELIHNATLLHDDVMDDADCRRSQPTARWVYGNTASILAGDYLLVYALQQVQSIGNGELLALLFEVITQMVTAESNQLAGRNQFNINRDYYLKIIEGKTAALFSWSLQAGGMIAGLSGEQIYLLREVGLHLGRSFQLVDDVLDVSGSPEVMGKNAFQDMQEGKSTWPMILALEADLALRERLQAWGASKQGVFGEEQIQSLCAAMTRVNALEETRAFARREVKMALDKLCQLPQSWARRVLQAVIESTVERLA